MTARRPRLLTIRATAVAALVLAVLAATFVIGRWSAPLGSASRAGNSDPPQVTVAVEQRRLEVRLDITGTIRAAAQTFVGMLSPSDVARTVVTAAPIAVGSPVRAGAVVVAISGRPIIALTGATPAYRNLRQGESGADVRQLQTALAQLHYRPERDAVFGPATAAAVAALYSSRGYPPVRDGPGSMGSIVVPAAELAFVPSLPAVLAALPVAAGADPTGKSIEIDSTAPAVALAQLSSQASASAPAAAVSLTCGSLTVTGGLGAPVSAPADPAAKPATGGGDGTADVVTRMVAPAAPIPATSVGAACVGSAVVAITAGPVLAVPASAIYDTLDRGSTVLVRDGAASTVVPVTLGRSGGGWVELREAPPTVRAGTQVVVGAGSP